MMIVVEFLDLLEVLVVVSEVLEFLSFLESHLRRQFVELLHVDFVGSHVVVLDIEVLRDVEKLLFDLNQLLLTLHMLSYRNNPGRIISEKMVSPNLVDNHLSVIRSRFRSACLLSVEVLTSH